MEALERYSISNDLPTVITIVVLLLLVMGRKLFPHRFDDFVSIFTSGKFFIIKNKEHKALFGFNVVLLIIHILIIPLFIFETYRSFISPSPDEPWVLFLRIFTAYSFFILLKITVEKIIATIFDIDEQADHYLFQKHTYRNFLSILLLPILIFLIYSPISGNSLIYIFLLLFITGSIFTNVRVIKKNMGLISRNWFYFILYLCALEISPYIILYKLFTNDKV